MFIGRQIITLKILFSQNHYKYKIHSVLDIYEAYENSKGEEKQSTKLQTKETQKFLANKWTVLRDGENARSMQIKHRNIVFLFKYYNRECLLLILNGPQCIA